MSTINPAREHIVKRLWFPFHNQRAITLGPFGIWYAQGAYTERTRRHEAVHWKDQKRWLYLPWYVAYLVLLLTVIGKPISQHPLEAPAYRAEREVV